MARPGLRGSLSGQNLTAVGGLHWTMLAAEVVLRNWMMAEVDSFAIEWITDQRSKIRKERSDCSLYQKH
jgi:hypothetical protein